MRGILVFTLVVITASFCQALQRCYGDLGCFSTTPGFDGLPQSPDHVRTTFNLYTRVSRIHSTHVVAQNDSTWAHMLNLGHFSNNKDTKFIVHGFLDNGHTDWIGKMKNALLTKGDFNVFVVDWGHGSKYPYDQATANLYLVSAELGKFMRYLQHSHGYSLARVHLIGHSLGAHCAGQAGSAAPGVGRITGLDPAEPYFDNWGADRRLDQNDAKFVDVIHSDGEPFVATKGFGLITPMGDIDFYPNGGVDQPGCTDTIGGMIGGLINPGVGTSVSCSHSRSHELFTESIHSPCTFRAHRCTDWASYESGRCRGCHGGCATMGYNSQLSGARGSFYLSTTEVSPFCGQEYFVEIDLSSKEQLTTGRIYVTLDGEHGNSHTVEFTRDNRQYHAGDKEKHMIAVHHSVGHVVSVKVTFKRKFGFFSPGKANGIVVDRVLIRDIYSSHQIKFCGHDVYAEDKVAVTLTSHTGC